MSYCDDGDCRRKKWSEWPLKARVGMIVAGVVLAPAFLALCAATTMWLWNWLIPGIFKLPAIGFWQAAGILILSHILFKGGRFGSSGKSRWGKPKVSEQMEGQGPAPKPV
jgi:hypothetical protein